MSNPKWPNNKKIPVVADEIDVVSDDIVSSLQIAALNETTDRATSKPKASITGQDYTGGDNTANQFQLGTNSNTATGPFISTGATNQTTFTNLYNNNTSKFNGRNINGVDVTNLNEFLRAVLGNSITENLNVACIYVPKNDSGVWTYPTAIPKGSGRRGAVLTNEWMIPPGLLLEILGHSAPGQGHNEIGKLSDITLAEMGDTTKLEPYLPSGFAAVAPKALAATDTLKQRVAGTSGNPSLLSNDPNEWWCDLKSCLGVFGAGGDPRVEADTTCNATNSGTDKTKGYNESTSSSTTFGTPLTVTNNALILDSTYVDPQDLPPQPQFTVSVPFDSTLMVNLATTIFDNPGDYALLSSDIVIEILKDSVEEVAGAASPPSIQVYLDNRPVQLDNAGDPESNQYNEESVIPAINRVHTKTNKAIGSAVELDQYLTQRVVGNPRSSQPGSEGESIYDAMSAAGYDPTTELALGRLNLIPMLSGDRLIETVLKLDNDGNIVYDSLGVPQVAYITQKQRAEMTPESRRERFMVHPDSDEPPTTLLEALWTNWRHISALTTDTYGISALTDINILDDKHTLISELSSNSFIENFNTLYNTNISLSGDLQLVIDAISGTNRTDTLIEQLSSYSIYENLNTIYTGMSANSACCDVTSTTLSTHTAEISSLSSYVVSLDKKIGTGGGISTCEGDDICSTLTDLHDTLINLEDPGGYTLEIPAGFPKHFKPHDEYVLDGSLCDNEVKPNSPIYKYYQDIQGAAPDVRYLWQHPDNSWKIGTSVCDADLSIINPDNLELSALSVFGKPVVRHESPYREFTERINKIVEFIDNPPNPVNDEINELSACCENNSVLLSSIGTDIMQLSSCCNTNTLTLSSLSSFVYGEPPTQVAPGLSAEGDVISIVNKLYTSIINLEENTGGDFSEHVENILKNQFNINILSGGVDIINTDIDSLSSSITNLEECCDTSLKIGDLDTHAVLLTGSQSVSGEKTFEHTLTVSTSANVGELITVGQGESVFYVCTDESDVSHVVMPLIQVDPVDLSSLPDGAVYARTTADGKQLMIK